MDSENRKVINATQVIYNGIKFRSKSELRMYQTMLNAGFTPDFESQSFILWDGCYLQKPYYYEGFPVVTKNGHTKKLQDWVYTPDFIITLGGCSFIIEVKGNPNDLWPYKRKLFLKLIDTMKDTYFFEVKTIKGLKKTLSTIKSIYDEKIASSKNGGTSSVSS